MGCGSSYQKSNYVEKKQSYDNRQPRKNNYIKTKSVKTKYIYENDYVWDKAKVVGRNE